MKKFFRGIIAVLSMLMIFSFTLTASATELVIFHTNDLHGRILPDDDDGRSIGLAEMSAAIKAVKAKNPDTLWLDAGDTIHGLPSINISKGKNMITLLEVAGLDAMTVGNHEFNYGLPVIENLVKESKFPILSANVAYKVKPAKSKTDLVFKPYVIKKLPNGLKVGIFGLTTPETMYKATPTFVQDLNFLDPVKTAREMVKQLRSKCDVLIALTHLGIAEEAEFPSTLIAKQVKGIDLIVDGHSHSLLPQGLTIENTLIVQAGEHGYTLGCVTIDIEKKKIVGKKAEILNADDVKKLADKPDIKVVTAIDEIEKANEPLFDKVITKNRTLFPYDERELCTKETELGNLAADAFRWRTDSDIAVINGAGIRKYLRQGDVTQRDVISIFPFGNYIEVVEITGSTIREMLEHSVYKETEPFNGFLQVSGIDFTFDPRRPVGERVGLIRVNGKVVEDDKIYTMATSNFLLQGGDDYEMLKKLLLIGQFGGCDEILADYIQEVGTSKVYKGRIINEADE